MRNRFERTAKNIFKHIQMLRAEAHQNELLVEQMVTGARPKPATRQIRERNERIVRIVQDFANPQRDRLQYLRAIARLF